jgi:hypothetical protein
LKPRVFFLHKWNTLDETSAEKWGEIVYLFDTIISPFNFTRFRHRILAKLSENGFDPERDYFGLSGPLSQVALALTFLSVKYSFLKILLFDGREKIYKERKFLQENS